jgi:hypothetical protein
MGASLACTFLRVRLAPLWHDEVHADECGTPMLRIASRVDAFGAGNPPRIA